jgi:hypothetical protein
LQVSRWNFYQKVPKERWDIVFCFAAPDLSYSLWMLRFAVAALWYAADVFPGTVQLSIATPTPETPWGLFEINAGAAEALEVATLRRTALGPIVLDFDVNVGNARKLIRIIRKTGKDVVPMGQSGD